MNIGILGAGNIAGSMARTICGMAAQGRPVTLYAVASRSQEKADAFAKAYGIPRAYGSYAAMLSDPLVELVYIATPHSHHAEQIRQCVAAGKPVLCEKSFTANAKQAEDVLREAEAARVYVAEAIWTRYMPARGMIADIIASGESVSRGSCPPIWHMMWSTRSVLASRNWRAAHCWTWACIR